MAIKMIEHLMNKIFYADQRINFIIRKCRNHDFFSPDIETNPLRSARKLKAIVNKNNINVIQHAFLDGRYDKMVFAHGCVIGSADPNLVTYVEPHIKASLHPEGHDFMQPPENLGSRTLKISSANMLDLAIRIGELNELMESVFRVAVQDKAPARGV